MIHVEEGPQHATAHNKGTANSQERWKMKFLQEMAKESLQEQLNCTLKEIKTNMN